MAGSYLRGGAGRGRAWRVLGALGPLVLGAGAGRLSAQDARDEPCAAAAWTGLPSGPAEDRARAWRLVDGTPVSLLRGSADSLRRALTDSLPPAGRVQWALVRPEVAFTRNSDLPFSLNDGPMWAGRGTAWSATAGIAVCTRHVGVVIAPTVWQASNDAFDLPTDPRIVPFLPAGGDLWANPYHAYTRSLDNPRRFGDRALRTVDPGTLVFWVRNQNVEAGFSTEPQWWGPGTRNALLLSTHAAGVPRLYVRPAREHDTRAGAFDGQYFVGVLRRSDFLSEGYPEDTARTLSGIAVQWRPWFARRELTLGVARVVAAEVVAGWAERLFDPIRSVGRPNARSIADTARSVGPDQLFSVMAHWRLPDDGVELWGEWGRAEQPRNLGDLLAAPNHSQAFTVGFQVVRPLRSGRTLVRVEGEHTQTTQSSTYRFRPMGSWYTSRAVSGGFSQRGQVLGAAIGPGGNAQWLAADVIRRGGSVGLFAGRIRWDDDSYYQIPRPNGNGLCKHDTSLLWGVRAGAQRPRWGAIDAVVTVQQRMNVWWQALGFCFANEELSVDARNLTLEFRWSPRGARGPAPSRSGSR